MGGLLAPRWVLNNGDVEVHQGAWQQVEFMTRNQATVSAGVWVGNDPTGECHRPTTPVLTVAFFLRRRLSAAVEKGQYVYANRWQDARIVEWISTPRLFDRANELERGRGMTRFHFYEHHQNHLLLQHATGLKIWVQKRAGKSEAHFELTGFVGDDDLDDEATDATSEKSIDGFDFARNLLDDFQNCAKGGAE